jgi:HEAT repeat protein
MLLATLVVAVPALPDADFGSNDKKATVREKEKEQEAYEEAQDALDDHKYERAAKLFEMVAGMGLEHADAALYWLADARNKLGRRSEALTALLALQKSFPKSPWAEDAKALEVEIRQGSGENVEPEHVNDEEIKLMAIQGLMNSDPEHAIPILEKILSSKTSTAKMKERALFVLTQSGSPAALEYVARAAKDSSNREMQERAIKYIGIMGSESARKILGDVYASTGDVDVKKQILKSYMIAGDKARLLALARSEPNAELRGAAVSQLGVLGASKELTELYNSESSIEIRKTILKAMFVGGSADKLAEIARTEKEPELRLIAIRNLGLIGGRKAADTLVSLYENDSNLEIRHTLIKSLFIQNSASALVTLARKEKDRDLKNDIISKLSLMRSKEAAEYLEEFLKE